MFRSSLFWFFTLIRYSPIPEINVKSQKKARS